AALAVAFFRCIALDAASTVAAGALAALPIAIIAMFAAYVRVPVFACIAVVTFPKLFRYLTNLFGTADAQPFVLAAQARGVGRLRILLHHVVPCVSLELLALLGISLSLAFGAAIPIEAFSDSPGIGQLAWQAALNRDLPLIINLSLLATL